MGRNQSMNKFIEFIKGILSFDYKLKSTLRNESVRNRIVSKDNNIINSNSLKRNKVLNAIAKGMSLIIQNNNDFLTAFPIEVKNSSITFINEDNHKIIKLDIDEFAIIQEGYCLEDEKSILKIKEDISKRASEEIEEIEYWNEKLDSVYLEEMLFISENASHIKIKDIDSGKIYNIRKPFLRSILFKGQRSRESIEKLNSPHKKYEGYDFYNSALEIIANRKYNKIVNSKDLNNIIRLLKRTVSDKTISSNTHASAYRILGELSEAKNDIRDAIEYYQNALSLNEKIGVKSKLKKLKTN